MRYSLNVKRPYDDKKGEEKSGFHTIGYASSTKKGFNLYFTTMPLTTTCPKGYPKVEDICMFPIEDQDES